MKAIRNECLIKTHTDTYVSLGKNFRIYMYFVLRKRIKYPFARELRKKLILNDGTRGLV